MMGPVSYIDRSARYALSALDTMRIGYDTAIAHGDDKAAGVLLHAMKAIAKAVDDLYAADDLDIYGERPDTPAPGERGTRFKP